MPKIRSTRETKAKSPTKTKAGAKSGAKRAVQAKAARVPKPQRAPARPATPVARPVAKAAPAPRKAPPPAETPAPSEGLAYAASKIRNIPDFPKPGILFKDITPLIANPRAFHIVLDALAERFIGEHIDAIVGVEARGFIFGGALAARLNASFVPVRKPGKLPGAADKVDYETEYSLATLEMHKGSIPEGARVVVVDDLLATGGTARAAAELVHKQGGYVVAYAFVVELSFLPGRERLLPVRVESVIRY